MDDVLDELRGEREGKKRREEDKRRERGESKNEIMKIMKIFWSKRIHRSDISILYIKIPHELYYR